MDLFLPTTESSYCCGVSGFFSLLFFSLDADPTKTYLKILHELR
jgi:hypothetical protein